MCFFFVFASSSSTKWVDSNSAQINLKCKYFHGMKIYILYVMHCGKACFRTLWKEMSLQGSKALEQTWLTESSHKLNSRRRGERQVKLELNHWHNYSQMRQREDRGDVFRDEGEKKHSMHLGTTPAV